MKLTIGLFIDALSKDSNHESLVIKKNDFKQFQEVWLSYDTENKGWITLEEF